MTESSDVCSSSLANESTAQLVFVTSDHDDLQQNVSSITGGACASGNGTTVKTTIETQQDERPRLDSKQDSMRSNEGRHDGVPEDDKRRIPLEGFAMKSAAVEPSASRPRSAGQKQVAPEAHKEHTSHSDKIDNSSGLGVSRTGQVFTVDKAAQENADTQFSEPIQVIKLREALEELRSESLILVKNVAALKEKCSALETSLTAAHHKNLQLEMKSQQVKKELLSFFNGIENLTNIKNDESTQETSTVEIKLIREMMRPLIDTARSPAAKFYNGTEQRPRFVGEGSSVIKTKCDELGFYMSPIDLDTNQTRALGSRALKSSSNESSSDIDGNMKKSTLIGMKTVDESKSNDVRVWRQKWDQFMKDFDKIDLNKSNEFKRLVRAGIPQEYRCKVWKALIGTRIDEERRRRCSDYYYSLVDKFRVNQAQKGEDYQVITDDCRKISIGKQIELDLLRTMPNNCHFENNDSNGTVRLRRILHAFSVRQPQIGYCQGMNRLVAAALLVLPEEEAFWCLVAIVEKIMPSGYYYNMWLAHADSLVVMDLVDAKIPQLGDHFRRNNIELSLFSWFLTIFVDGTPPSLFMRLWDSFLHEGDKIMFRVAIALLKQNENHILKINDAIGVNNFILSAVNESMNTDHLFSLAFDWANPLPGKWIKVKRELSLQKFKSNLEIAKNPIIKADPSSSGTT